MACDNIFVTESTACAVHAAAIQYKRYQSHSLWFAVRGCSLCIDLSLFVSGGAGRAGDQVEESVPVAADAAGGRVAECGPGAGWTRGRPRRQIA